MLTLYRSGRQAEALDDYQQARRRLVDELGIDPGTRLRNLEAAILANETMPSWQGQRRSTLALFANGIAGHVDR